VRQTLVSMEVLESHHPASPGLAFPSGPTSGCRWAAAVETQERFCAFSALLPLLRGVTGRCTST
jgi:hypothetical protein